MTNLVHNFIEFAHNSLLDNEKAQEYLLGRGSSRDQWARHKIGYVGRDFDVNLNDDPNHNSDCSLNSESLCDSCRFVKWSSASDGTKKVVGRRLLGGIVLPLSTYSGTHVGFQIRSIDHKSYDTYTIRRRPEAYFFGIGSNIHSIWASRLVWIVEGPMDQLIMERLITPSVIAVTTNSLSFQHIKFLNRFVDTVNLCLDMDAAGIYGARNILDRDVSFHVNHVKYVKPGYPAKDPGDLWKLLGDHKFSEHFKKVAVL